MTVTRSRSGKPKGASKAAREETKVPSHRDSNKRAANAAAVEPPAKRCCGASLSNPCCEEFRTRIIDIRAGMREIREEVLSELRDEVQSIAKDSKIQHQLMIQMAKFASGLEQQLALQQTQLNMYAEAMGVIIRRQLEESL